MALVNEACLMQRYPIPLLGK